MRLNFQTVTSNLDWDEEALEDKFLQGLKPHVKDGLIYFQTEPEILEELYERAQKIDRKWWERQQERKTQRNRNTSSSYKRFDDIRKTRMESR